MNRTFALAVFLLALAPAAHAVESSSHAPDAVTDTSDAQTKASYTGSANVFATSMSTALNTLKTQLDEVKNCNTQGKLWNGTTCVTAGVGSGGDAPRLAAVTAVTTTPSYLWGPYASRMDLTLNNGAILQYSITCSCTEQQQMPSLRTVGTMLLIEPISCVLHSLTRGSARPTCLTFKARATVPARKNNPFTKAPHPWGAFFARLDGRAIK